MRRVTNLMPLVYEELHRLAHRYMNRERPGHTLQTSALVNEAFMKLIDQKDVHWQNRAHFFGLAAQMMRRILVDYARSRQYAKRGGGAERVSFDEALVVSQERVDEVVALDDALKELAQFDQRKSQIVELRFFGGLNIEETAELLKVSPGTVMRDWALPKRGCVSKSSASGELLRVSTLILASLGGASLLSGILLIQKRPAWSGRVVSSTEQECETRHRTQLHTARTLAAN